MKAAKILIMGAMAVAAWIADWILIKQSIYNNQSLIFFGWPSLTTIVAIVLLTFFFLINRNRVTSLIVDSIIFIAYLVIMPREFYVVLGGAIFLVFLLLFEQRIRMESKSTVDFSLRRTMSGSISLVLYALLILIGFNIFYDIQTDFKANPDAYYDKLTVAATKTVPYVTQSFPEIPEHLKQEVAKQQAVDAVGRIKVAASGYQDYFPLIFAIIVTGLLLTFAFLIRWASIVVGWLIFKAFLWVGFFKLHPQTVEVQKLDI